MKLKAPTSLCQPTRTHMYIYVYIYTTWTIDCQQIRRQKLNEPFSEVSYLSSADVDSWFPSITISQRRDVIWLVFFQAPLDYSWKLALLLELYSQINPYINSTPAMRCYKWMQPKTIEIYSKNHTWTALTVFFLCTWYSKQPFFLVVSVGWWTKALHQKWVVLPNIHPSIKPYSTNGPWEKKGLKLYFSY